MDGQPDSIVFRRFHCQKFYLTPDKKRVNRKINPKNRNHAVENLFMRQHCYE